MHSTLQELGKKIVMVRYLWRHWYISPQHNKTCNARMNKVINYIVQHMDMQETRHSRFIQLYEKELQTDEVLQKLLRSERSTNESRQELWRPWRITHAIKEYLHEQDLDTSVYFYMCTMHITATAIIFHMYHSMYATHLNYTYTHIHITSQAIDRMMKTLWERIAHADSPQ